MDRRYGESIRYLSGARGYRLHRYVGPKPRVWAGTQVRAERHRQRSQENHQRKPQSSKCEDTALEDYQLTRTQRDYGQPEDVPDKAHPENRLAGDGELG